MPDSVMDKARRIRGERDYLLGRVDRAAVREARQYQRDVVLPVLSGLHSRDPQRKARLAWLRSIGMERFLAGVDRVDRVEHILFARSAAQLLRWQPWKPVLP